MQPRFLLFLAVLTAPVSVVFADNAVKASALSVRLLDDVYRPLHRDFANDAMSWRDEAGNLCERRPASSAYKTQLKFAKLVERYGAIEFFRLGPLEENKLRHRLFYWPDRKGIIKRQLSTLLNSTEQPGITSEDVSGKSVAVQGFTALERLLFDVSLQPIETFPQCSAIVAVIGNIAQIADELQQNWDSTDTPLIQSLLVPQPDSQYFRDQQEIVRGIFTQVSVGLDAVLDERLKLILSNDEKSNRRAPLWFSQRSVALLTGNLQGLQSLLLDSGILAGTRFDEKLANEFRYIETVLADLKPITWFVDDDGRLVPEVRVLMHKLAAVVAGVRYIVTNELSRELGVSPGFNSADGD